MTKKISRNPVSKILGEVSLLQHQEWFSASSENVEKSPGVQHFCRTSPLPMSLNNCIRFSMTRSQYSFLQCVTIYNNALTELI